jgi:lipid-A-disaccharide synthase
VSPTPLLVVAGEASGDLHAAPVLACLRALVDGLEPFGLGGPRLVAAGLERVGDPSPLNVVGLSEALGRLPAALGLRRRLLLEVARRRPRAALLVDLPGFNLGLAGALAARGVRVVQYVAPQAWAWRPGRVRAMAERLSRLCVIFPFEESYFAARGVPAEFVGHPLLEAPTPQRLEGPPTLALVPGSRPHEVRRLLPPLAAAARLLRARLPGLEVVLPLAPGLSAGRVRAWLGEAGLAAELVEGGADQAFARARLGLVASGTAVLEGALGGVPMVVVYRVSWPSYALARALVRVRHVAIVNLLAGRELVPELLQSAVRPERVAALAEPLWVDGPARARAEAGLAEVVRELGARRPSERVAAAVAELLFS